MSILIDGDVLNLTGVVNDTSYEFRSRLTVQFYFTQKAVGASTALLESSLQYPTGEKDPETQEPTYTPTEPPETDSKSGPWGDEEEPTSEVEAKAGVVNCCDTAKWYGKDMTPEEKAELKKGQREWEKSRFRKWICQEALSAINESDVKKIKETGRQEGGKMNNHWCKVSAMACITAEDVDLILYEALNAGGISAWSDAVKTVGDKLGKRVCEQVALGGELMIHEIGGEWHKLSWQNLMSGVEQYLNESCHIRIEDERLALDDLTTNEADVIVQFALFGETKF